MENQNTYLFRIISPLRKGHLQMAGILCYAFAAGCTYEQSDKNDAIIKYKSESYASAGAYNLSIQEAKKIGKNSKYYSAAQEWIDLVEKTRRANKRDLRDGKIRVNPISGRESWP